MFGRQNVLWIKLQNAYALLIVEAIAYNQTIYILEIKWFSATALLNETLPKLLDILSVISSILDKTTAESIC